MKSKEEVSLDLIETMTFSMAKALDHLGYQGQVMLNKIGEEMVSYLVERGEIEPTEDPFSMMSKVERYFAGEGYKAMARQRFVKDEVISEFRPGSWTHARTWIELRNKDCSLLACPACVSGFSLLRKAGLGPVLVSATHDGRGTITTRGKLMDLRKKKMVKHPVLAFLRLRLKYAFGWS